ncbi:UvrD-helicase domain-containing protein [Nitrincola sp. A-D6]|uniref:UvrD-helicase domain-containing protein n=1 Tax=Nitrincola sp. A-D6 TaxID=1545442 RepID=UPI002285B22A|nr:UvrD-helicase domain-containing protein [Nitrincola sp. A-D6]
MAAALDLVLNYFSWSKDKFIQTYFGKKEAILKRATSEDSWKKIVDPLSKNQRDIVVDDQEKNRLILAGPGSGKTRVIVHRVAYLLRVLRAPATAIVVLAFNRHAANEIRERIQSLVGRDSFGVTVMTYHSMAMRLTGVRFNRDENVDEARLAAVLEDAINMLGGGIKTARSEDDNDLREQVLRGYRYILVDEYQDIDELQYQLISALAGRNLDDDQRLCILAVGDDDQNIYSFRKTSNEYIERFQNDYEADIHYLIENYRSTKNIISASNLLIEKNAGRLKYDHPIEINKARKHEAAGGDWSKLDLWRGEIVCLQLANEDREEGNLQAQAILQRLTRLIENGANWSDCAILARTHKFLQPIQA